MRNNNTTMDSDKTTIRRYPRKAFIEGMEIGFTDGYKIGVEDGYAKGYDTGYNEGFKSGYLEANTAREMYSEP